MTSRKLLKMHLLKSNLVKSKFLQNVRLLQEATVNYFYICDKVSLVRGFFYMKESNVKIKKLFFSCLFLYIS